MLTHMNTELTGGVLYDRETYLRNDGRVQEKCGQGQSPFQAAGSQSQTNKIPETINSLLLPNSPHHHCIHFQ